MTELGNVNPELSEEPAPTVLPLDYRTPRSSPNSLSPIPRASLAAAGKGLFGAILTSFLWGAVGLYHMDRLPLIVGESKTLRPLSMRIAVFYFAVSGISLVLLFAVRKRGQHLMDGLLTGSAIAGMIGGMMFVAGR